MPAKVAPKPADPGNAKGELIAACRTLGLPDPTFDSESGGPGHAPWFRCVVLLGERELGTGEGRSKRDAERAASLEALKNVAAPTPDLDSAPGSAPGSASGQEPDRAHRSTSVPVPAPIYAEVLSQALLVAHERREHGTPTQVAHDAALLYRRLLQGLGHIPEEK